MSRFRAQQFEVVDTDFDGPDAPSDWNETTVDAVTDEMPRIRARRPAVFLRRWLLLGAASMAVLAAAVGIAAAPDQAPEPRPKKPRAATASGKTVVAGTSAARPARRSKPEKPTRKRSRSQAPRRPSSRAPRARAVPTQALATTAPSSPTPSPASTVSAPPPISSPVPKPQPAADEFGFER